MDGRMDVWTRRRAFGQGVRKEAAGLKKELANPDWLNLDWEGGAESEMRAVPSSPVSCLFWDS